MTAGKHQLRVPCEVWRGTGPAGIAARMLAASPAGMPAVLALPRGIMVATAWPAAAWPRDGSPPARHELQVPVHRPIPQPVTDLPRARHETR